VVGGDGVAVITVLMRVASAHFLIIICISPSDNNPCVNRIIPAAHTRTHQHVPAQIDPVERRDILKVPKEAAVESQ
jgi:hypothetical protein